MQVLVLLLVIAQGVTGSNILIGMEGPAQSFSTDEENLGMHLVIRHVNARGGIHGRKIEVVAYPRDRENIAEQALLNVRRLNEQDQVFLLFNFGGPAAVPIGFCHYPDPNESDAPGIVEYRRLMAEYFPQHALNRYSLYGYAFGSLVVEGLERAGVDLTRDSFLDAMDSIRDWDSGGILPPVSFSATDHHAQDAGFICELKNGRFVALSDWLAP